MADSEFTIAADQVVKAVGQEKPSLAERLGLAIDRGYIRVDANFETSISGVFAGGDCVRVRNAASTVMAVQDGKIAVTKAGGRARGGAAASDAFFPFRDGLDVLAEAGVAAVVSPGGSVKDGEVVAAADEHGIAMVFTGIRHFRH